MGLNISILGGRHQGKSTLSVAVALTLSRRVVVFDPGGQYRRESWIYTKKPDEVYNLLRYDDKPMIIVFEPGRHDSEARFNELFQAVWGPSELPWLRDFTFIVDEASKLQKPQAINSNYEWMLRRAPVDFHTISISHRIADFHRDQRNLSTHQFVFRTENTDDQRALEREYGIEPGRVGALREFHFYHRFTALGGISKHAIFRDPKAWEINLGSSQSEAEVVGESPVSLFADDYKDDKIVQSFPAALALSAEIDQLAEEIIPPISADGGEPKSLIDQLWGSLIRGKQ